SPVQAQKPGSSSTRTSSMRARFWTASSRSISALIIRGHCAAEKMATDRPPGYPDTVGVPPAVGQVNDLSYSEHARHDFVGNGARPGLGSSQVVTIHAHLSTEGNAHDR